MKKSVVLLLLPFLAFSFSLNAKPKRMSERGIYITSSVAHLPVRFGYLREQAKKAGLNTLVIDAKDSISKNYIDLLRERALSEETRVIPSPWLSRLVADLHKEGFIVTARIVVFKDDRLALARPDLAVQGYRDRKGGRWTDPYSDEVRLYNALIAESAAASGADEVQFDYVRFPAEGSAASAVYSFEKAGVSRVDIICQFLKEARERVAKYNTSLAVDIFGVTAWQSKNDIQALGQDLKRMAKYLDVISPMLYPSHFHAGYDGFANPGSHPYYFINTGVAKAKEILSGEATVLVPWIQGFDLNSPNFGPNYIAEQVRGAKEAGVERFLIWNARNVYDVSFQGVRLRE